MSREPHDLAIKRILVALDTSTDSLTALEAAAGLAAAIQAELVGLFVEDINLLRLATLPFTYEVQRATGIRRDIDHDSMEYDLQLQASQARRALASAATRFEVQWSFKVVRGVVKKEILEAALQADLLTLGRSSSSLARNPGLGSTARAAVEGGPGFVFLSGPDSPRDRPVFVTFDGSRAGSQAVIAACRVAVMNNSKLVVFLIRPDMPDESWEPGEPWEPREPAVLAEQCDEILKQQEYLGRPDYRQLPLEQSLRLIHAAQKARCSLLVLGGESPFLQGEALQFLLDELACPVMLVR